MTMPDAGGDPDWSGIYEDHAPALYRRSQRILGPEPHTSTGVSAEDTVQETFARVMKQGLRYEGTYFQLRSYLQRQLGWVLSEVWAEQNRRKGAGYMSLDELPPDQTTGTNSIGEVVDRLDDAQVVKISLEHLRCLTPNERQVWEEHVRRGRPVPEVATQLRVTPTRIRQLRRSAGFKLLRCVANPDHD